MIYIYDIYDIYIYYIYILMLYISFMFILDFMLDRLSEPHPEWGSDSFSVPGQDATQD